MLSLVISKNLLAASINQTHTFISYLRRCQHCNIQWIVVRCALYFTPRWCSSSRALQQPRQVNVDVESSTTRASSWVLTPGYWSYESLYIYSEDICCTSLTVTFACGGCYKHLEEAESAVGSWGLRVCWVHSGHQAHLKKSRFSPSHKSLLEMMLFLIESVKAINLKISSNYFVQDVNEVIYYRWIIL